MSNVQQSAVAPSTLTAALPRFLSRGHTYRAVVGDTLVLPCQVENLGEFRVYGGELLLLDTTCIINPTPLMYSHYM